MGRPTSHGAEQEHRYLKALCITYAARLEPRGITSALLGSYDASVDDMQGSHATVTEKRATGKDKTKKESNSKNELHITIQKIQEGARLCFGKKSDLLRQFHVGDHYGRSTSRLIEWAKDIESAWATHETLLTTKGKLVASDLTELIANREALEADDTVQEVSRKQESPQATAAAAAKLKAVTDIADEIEAAAKMEFIREPLVLKEFQHAYELRFTPPPPGGNDGDTPPPPPEPPPAP